MDASRRIRILRQHVQTEQLMGVEFVPQASPAPGEKQNRPTIVHSEQSSPAGAKVAPPPTQLSLSVDKGGAPSRLDRDSRIRILSDIDVNEVRSCTECPLCNSRTQTVFGEGDPEARLMFIGEGPGQNEDEQGRPFVGRAGELLNKQITAMGLEREQVYIANVVKCRPPNNRAPTPVEVDACNGYLQRQIQTIAPEVIITLGAPATKLILDTREGITRIRGKWFTYNPLLSKAPPIPVMPTFHPAYLLRSYTAENRRRVWSDLQKVMERLGLS